MPSALYRTFMTICPIDGYSPVPQSHYWRRGIGLIVLPGEKLTMKTTKRLRVWTIVAALGAVPVVASASIMGELDISGNAVISGIGASGRIHFGQVASPPCHAGESLAVILGTGFFSTALSGGDGCG